MKKRSLAHLPAQPTSSKSWACNWKPCWWPRYRARQEQLAGNTINHGLGRRVQRGASFSRRCQQSAATITTCQRARLTPQGLAAGPESPGHSKEPPVGPDQYPIAQSAPQGLTEGPAPRAGLWPVALCPYRLTKGPGTGGVQGPHSWVLKPQTGQVLPVPSPCLERNPRAGSPLLAAIPVLPRPGHRQPPPARTHP